MAQIGKPLIVEPLPLINLASDGGLIGHPVSHLGRFKAPGLTWKTSAGGTFYITGEFGSAKPVDFVALVGLNASSITKWQVRLGVTSEQVNGTAPYFSGLLNAISTTPAVAPDDGRHHTFLRIPVVQNASHFRVDVSTQTYPYEAVALVFGQAIEPSRYYNLDYEQGAQDLGEIEISRWGVFDEQPGLIWRTLDFTLGWQNEGEFETQFRPLMSRVGKRGVVYCCFDSTDSPYRNARTYMGPLRKPLFARHARKPRTFSQEFSILSYI